MAFSGHCVISNFTQGRDSNRGGCAHSCRFEYEMNFEGHDKITNAHFMSSKDLNALSLLWDLKAARIDSLKVEGRMKGPLYAAVTTKAYSQALQFLKLNPSKSEFISYIREHGEELNRIPHRDYTQGSFTEVPGKDSIFLKRDHDGPEFPLSAWVREVKAGKSITLEVKKSFARGESLEFIPFCGPNIVVKMDSITDLKGNEIEKTNPSTLVRIPYIAGLSSWNVARRVS